MNGKIVYLLGDMTSQKVTSLIAQLQQTVIEVRVPKEDDRFNAVLLCFTEQPYTQEIWKVIDANRNARFIPILFPGGEAPAIFADIKPADFRRDTAQAFAALLVAIERLC